MKDTSKFIDPNIAKCARTSTEKQNETAVLAEGVQTRFPGCRFARKGEVNAPAGAVGFGLLNGERLQTIVDFLDFAPVQTAEAE